MTFHIAIIALIATALLMCSLSLIGDGLAWYKSRRLAAHGSRHGTSASNYPHPIANGYPVERAPLPADLAAGIRSAQTRWQWRRSGAAMSEMRAVFGSEKSGPESAAR
jgi:hypothetical protein